MFVPSTLYTTNGTLRGYGEIMGATLVSISYSFLLIEYGSETVRVLRNSGTQTIGEDEFEEEWDTFVDLTISDGYARKIVIR